MAATIRSVLASHLWCRQAARPVGLNAELAASPRSSFKLSQTVEDASEDAVGAVGHSFPHILAGGEADCQSLLLESEQNGEHHLEKLPPKIFICARLVERATA